MISNPWQTVLALGCMMLISLVVLRAAHIVHPWQPFLAVLRAGAQLAVISAILAGALKSTWLVAALLGLMFAVATWTSSHRLGSTRMLAPTGASMAAGIIVTLTIIFATGAIAPEPRYLLAVGGMVIGNTMSVATMSGRRLRENLSAHWEQVEGWLALGATPRVATADEVRLAVREALIPSIDQTRTTGLVTLPGAFVGAIFGGASPLEAARFQLVVLAAIMCTAAITALILTHWIAPRAQRPTLAEERARA